ncbi:MAG: hypothetical protein ABEI74_01025 [Candidatus Pacearchaeota archaeon]
MDSRKRVIVLACVFLALLVFPVVQAQTNSSNESQSDSSSSTSSIDEMARSCIRNKVEKRGCSALGIEDQIFTLASTGLCESNLTNRAVNGECFGTNACNVKHTAQASLALENAGKNVSNYTDWIKGQNKTASEMSWFLQVDSNKQTTCSIRDLDGNTYQVGINSDKELSLNNNQDCLSVSDNGYWLEVDSSCYTQSFEISCEDSFSTNLLFSRDDSSTVFVTDQIQSSSGGGTTVEEMQQSLCLTSSGGNDCSYEDTLWGVLALEELGRNASEYYPYLEAFSQDNEELLPEAFLYQLTGDKNYRSDLILKQKADRYWRETDNRYYDTAVALMALSGESPEAKSNALDWLEAQQGKNGCWNDGSIRDTGFLLHSAWPERQGSLDTNNNDSGPSLGGGKPSCEAQGNYCVSGIQCNEAGGDIVESFSCTDFGERCCTKKPQKKTCSALGGEICSSSEQCDGSVEGNASGLGIGETCCLGTCEPEGDDENTCSTSGGTCKSQCGPQESESSVYSCSASGQVCCMQDVSDSDGGLSPWIFVLVILILLTALAIVFKDKLKKIYLRYKSKSGKGGKGSSRPGPAPGNPPRRPPQGPPGPKKRPPQGPRKQPPPKVIEKKRGRNPPSQDKKKEIDDVLGKLKKIGK